MLRIGRDNRVGQSGGPQTLARAAPSYTSPLVVVVVLALILNFQLFVEDEEEKEEEEDEKETPIAL